MLHQVRGSVFVLVVAVAVAGCPARPQRPYVRLNPDGGAAVPAAVRRTPAKTLRVAAAPMYSSEETLHAFGDLAAYLGRRVGRDWELLQRGTYAETNDLIRSRGCDLGFVCTYAYLTGRQEFGMDALVVPQSAGKTVYHSYLIVPADSPARSWEDLRGKVFAFTDPLSNSGRLYPTYVLAGMGEAPEHIFRECIYTYAHDKSVNAVAEKWVDGAAVLSLVYDYLARHRPELTRKTRIIKRSEPYGNPPVVVHPDIDPALKHRLRELLLRMHEDPEGRRILRQMLVDRFVPVDERMYDSVRRMMGKMQGKR